MGGRITRGIAAAVLMLACAVGALALSGCGQTNETVISNGLVNDFTAIKSGNTDTMQEYFGFDPSEAFTAVGISKEDFAAAFFKNLSIKVNSVEVGKDEATADVTITTSNYSNGLAIYDSKVTSYLKENGTFTGDDTAVQKQAAQLYLDAMGDNGIGTVTNDVTLSYKLEDKTWMLQNQFDLVYAVFGAEMTGMDTTTDATSTAISTDTGVGTSSAATSSATDGQ